MVKTNHLFNFDNSYLKLDERMYIVLPFKNKHDPTIEILISLNQGKVSK